MTGLVDLNPEHLAIVKHILAEHVPECEVRAFGSRATWNSRDTSDLDLVVIGDGPLPNRILTMLKEAFEESRLPMRVDVIDWSTTADSFRELIDPNTVVVQDVPSPSEWREVAIGEIADIVGGGTPSTKNPKNFEGNIPWLTPKDLSGTHERYIERGERNLSQQGLDSSSAKLLPPGSVLLSTRAPIGYVALAKNQIATNQGFRSLVVRDCAIPEYLYYWLMLNTEELERHASGSTFRELSGSSLKEIRLSLPPLEEQRAIARVLGKLDDKIELNRHMSETLEEMARALFKSWFVDFDPVWAKAEGRPSGLPPNLDVLFPASFEVSEWGEIPSGWEVKTLGDAFRITMGQSPPGKTYNQDEKGLPFYQGRTDFGFRFPGRRVYCTEPTRFAEKGDTLVSVRAPVGDVNMAMESCCVGRGVAAVRHLSGSCSYTYYSMQSLRDTFQQFEAEGTVFGAIGKRDFLSMRWVSPPNRLVEQFEESCSVMDNQIETNEIATSLLSAVQRDTLLPRVLSGHLRIAS